MPLLIFLSYSVRVYGKGTVDGIDYFIGDRKERFYGSGYEAADYFALRDSVRIMQDRAALFQAVMPGVSIDTDAGSCGSRRDFMRYARECVRFGVPDLYILNPIEDCALTAEDWEEIRAIWDAYRQAPKSGGRDETDL